MSKVICVSKGPKHHFWGHKLKLDDCMNLKQKTFNYWIRCYLYNNKYILFLRRRRSHLSDMIMLLSLPYLLL